MEKDKTIISEVNEYISNTLHDPITGELKELLVRNSEISETFGKLISTKYKEQKRHLDEGVMVFFINKSQVRYNKIDEYDKKMKEINNITSDLNLIDTEIRKIMDPNSRQSRSKKKYVGGRVTRHKKSRRKKSMYKRSRRKKSTRKKSRNKRLTRNKSSSKNWLITWT